ncbi:MAG: PH domain-containing protein [Nocardioidaceae bacterium]|nr:PH domain-containing protein [Nocardioidaceae bacterium]
MATLRRVTGVPADALFFEPGVAWRPVSPKLVTERRLPVLAVALVGVAMMILGAALQLVGAPVLWPLVMAGLLVTAVAAVLWFVVVPRVVSSWRYAERAQDLLIRHGRVYRRLTVVPYGRMQVIEVSANPISHRLGIATVTLVTASANTNAKIPGLPMEVAQELRDRLAAKGEAMTAGL